MRKVVIESILTGQKRGLFALSRISTMLWGQGLVFFSAQV